MSQNSQRAPDSYYFGRVLSADSQGDTSLAERYYSLARRMTWCPQIPRDAKRWWEKAKRPVIENQ